MHESRMAPDDEERKHRQAALCIVQSSADRNLEELTDELLSAPFSTANFMSTEFIKGKFMSFGEFVAWATENHAKFGDIFHVGLCQLADLASDIAISRAIAKAIELGDSDAQGLE